MATVTCKRCLAPGLYWMEALKNDGTSGWALKNASGDRHYCESDTIKTVKCKYCQSDDLHWAEDSLKKDGTKKMVLTESYGLPHACDERIAHASKEKQDKKDKYEAIKTRVNTTPDGKCKECDGKGTHGAYHVRKLCVSCAGHGKFDGRSRRLMLAHVRNEIWPHFKKTMYDDIPF